MTFDEILACRLSRRRARAIRGDGFGSPDGLWRDARGVLWIQTDASTSVLQGRDPQDGRRARGELTVRARRRRIAARAGSVAERSPGRHCPVTAAP